MTTSPLQTEYEFTLPQGYTDDGERHTDGAMRLATAADEIKPQTDPRVQSNPSYVTIILLSRVVTRLGTIEEVTPHVIENLYVNDLAHLQDLYERINERGANVVDAVCPACGEAFEVEVERESRVATDVGAPESGTGSSGPETLRSERAAGSPGGGEGNPEDG